MGFFGTISDLLVVILGLLFLIIAFINFFGSCGFMGRTGAKFIYEMDIIMGGLIGVSNYSKYEGVVMLLGALGCIQILGTADKKQLWIILGLLAGGSYMLICVAYAYYAKQPIKPFIVMAAVIWVVEIWRVVGYLDRDDYGNVGIVFVIAMLAVEVATWRMGRRVESREEINDRYRRIQEYCEENPDYVWIPGDDCPVGFE